MLAIHGVNFNDLKTLNFKSQIASAGQKIFCQLFKYLAV